MRMLLVTVNGANRKLGPGVATTYRPVGPSCPPDCPMSDECYAKRGHVTIHATRSEGRSDPLRKAAGATLLRHVVSGDWFKTAVDGRKLVDRQLLAEAVKVHTEAPWLTGWGYTHGAERLQRAGYGPGTWPENFRILASCDSPEEKAKLNKAGWQTARVIAEKGDCLPDEKLCPYDAAKRTRVPAVYRTTCAQCRACFVGKQNIAFLKF